ncbi:MAG: ATP-binding protein [Gemmatimonadota bacterium]|nr:ATP-binding protein [Gemmatimonadota bacterium]
MSRREEGGNDPVEVRARGLWALWFVAGALVALAALPAYIGNQVGEAQTHINDVLQPASNLSSRLSLLNSRQMARFEGFVLSGDGSFRRAYVGAIAEEDTVYEQLNVLARDLDLEVRERLAELSAASTRWHIDNQRVLALDEPEERAAALSSSRSQYASLQRATELFDRAIQSEVRAGRRRMAQARTRQSRITIALAILALATTFMVGRVGSRLKGLTREAWARRRDALRARREMDALLDATGDGVLGIDLEGACTSLNRAGAKLLGYTEEEIRGRDVHDTLHEERADRTPRHRGESRVLAALAEGEPADSDGVDVLRTRDGTPLPVKWALRPLIDGTELRGAVLTFTDMTEIQRKEEELREAIRQREDVVSIVSHDLRNPLGVVFGATDILLELPLDDAGRKRQAEIIGRAATRMSNLIEDLLDVARIQDGVLVVRRALEDVSEVVEEAVTLFREQADRKGVHLAVDVRGSALRARLDRDRVLQALTNLLDNAVRLTPAGGRVTLVAGVRDGRVAIEVADTGPGIPQDSLERIFDRYWQKEDGSRGTTGLGLTIVKGVVDAHGGKVRVASTVGEGTTFTLLFPVAISEAARESMA